MITIVEKDRVGLLADVLFVLEKTGVSINSANVELILGKAVLFLDPNDDEKSRNALTAAGFFVLAPLTTLAVTRSRAEGARSLAAMLKKNGVTVYKIQTLAACEKKNLISILSDNPKKTALLLKGNAAAPTAPD